MTSIAYGTGGNRRAFTYNSTHEPATDTLSTAAGATITQTTYGYDNNGDLTNKTLTGPGGILRSPQSHGAVRLGVIGVDAPLLVTAGRA